MTIKQRPHVGPRAVLDRALFGFTCQEVIVYNYFLDLYLYPSFKALQATFNLLTLGTVAFPCFT
jgi:hypothetical protein